MRCADIDQPCFFATADDFYGKTQSRLKSGEQISGIFCHAQGIGGHYTYGFRLKTTQTLTELREC